MATDHDQYIEMPRGLLTRGSLTISEDPDTELERGMRFMAKTARVPVFAVPASSGLDVNAVIKRLGKHISMGNCDFVYPDDGLFVFVLAPSSVLPQLNPATTYSNWSYVAMSPNVFANNKFASPATAWNDITISYCVRVRNPYGNDVMAKKADGGRCGWLTQNAFDMLSMPNDPNGMPLQVTDVYMRASTPASRVALETSNAIVFATSLMFSPVFEEKVGGDRTVGPIMAELPKEMAPFDRMQLWFEMRKQSGMLEIPDCYIDSSDVFMVTFNGKRSVDVAEMLPALFTPEKLNPVSLSFYNPHFGTVCPEIGTDRYMWRAGDLASNLSNPSAVWARVENCSARAIMELLSDVATPVKTRFARGKWKVVLGTSAHYGTDRDAFQVWTLAHGHKDVLLQMDTTKLTDIGIILEKATELKQTPWKQLTLSRKSISNIALLRQELETLFVSDKSLLKCGKFESGTIFALSAAPIDKMDKNWNMVATYAVPGCSDESVQNKLYSILVVDNSTRRVVYMAQSDEASGMAAAQILLLCANIDGKPDPKEARDDDDDIAESGLMVVVPNVDVRCGGMDPAFWYFHAEKLKRVLMFANIGMKVVGTLNGELVATFTAITTEYISGVLENAVRDILNVPEEISHFNKVLWLSTLPTEKLAELNKMPLTTLFEYSKPVGPVPTDASAIDASVDSAVQAYIKTLEKGNHVMNIIGACQPSLMGSYDVVVFPTPEYSASQALTWIDFQTPDAYPLLTKDIGGSGVSNVWPFLVSPMDLMQQFEGPTYLKRVGSMYGAGFFGPPSLFQWLPSPIVDAYMSGSDRWDGGEKHTRNNKRAQPKPILAKGHKKRGRFERSGVDEADSVGVGERMVPVATQVEQQQVALAGLKKSLKGYNDMMGLAEHTSRLLRQNLRRI